MTPDPKHFDPTPWLADDRETSFSPLKLNASMPFQTRGTKKRVCVIGGGIAGLVAAYELKELGHKVTLLEAADRFGGRIYTYHFKDHYAGQYYGELGAMRIPFDHACTLNYVTKFKLTHATFVQDNADAYFFLRGQRLRKEPWVPLQDSASKLYRRYPDVRNKFGDIRPEDVLEAQFDKIAPKAQALNWDVFKPGPLTGWPREWDRFSVWQHFQGIVAPQRPAGPPPNFFNDAEQEYIGRSTGMLWDEHKSYLEALVAILPHFGPSMYTIEGGVERLIDEFVADLQRSPTTVIHRNAPVTAVTVGESDAGDRYVRVKWGTENWSEEKEFDYVICALQAGPTVRIKFHPPLQPMKYEALSNLSYQPAAKSLVLCNTRRWEKVDKIFGGGSHTDMEIQECWYPPDNAEERSVKRFELQMAIGNTGPRREADRKRITEWQAKDPAVSNDPGVLIAAYMRGTNARRFASLPDDQRDALVRAGLEELHPGIGPEIVAIKHHSWDAETNPGGGAWAAFGPGERGRYQEAMVEPYPIDGKYRENDDYRVFFAGDHLGITHGWIQSAIQTGQGAAYHVNRA